MRGGLEGGHVAAGLGDDHLCGAALHAGDRARQLNRRGERGDLLLDRGRQTLDRFVQEVDVGEDLPDDQRVLCVETALERLAQRGELRAQLAARDVGERVRVRRSATSASRSRGRCGRAGRWRRSRA
jgi:hypothetical protein